MIVPYDSDEWQSYMKEMQDIYEEDAPTTEDKENDNEL